MKAIFILIYVLFTSYALAAGGDPGHIPAKFILVQVFNFACVVILLYFLLRKKLAGIFAQREKDFKEMVEKANAAKTEAEQMKIEIFEKLKELQQTEKDNVAKAESEATALKEKMISEAKAMADKLTKEAGNNALFEVERAKQTLRDELMKLALEAAEEALKDVVDAPNQKRLQNEFVEKIQVVRS